MLDTYEQPWLDPAIRDALTEYADRRKAEMPDAHI